MRSSMLVPRLLLLTLFCTVSASAAPHGEAMDGPRPEPEVKAEIETLITEHAAVWNRGDLEEFAGYYAEDAVFLSPTGVTRGRDEVLARYQDRYPDKSAMGHLTLEVLDMRFAYGEVGEDGHRTVTGVSVAGRWTLTYPEGDREEASGLTLVVLRPGPQGGWLIVQDASM